MQDGRILLLVLVAVMTDRRKDPDTIYQGAQLISEKWRDFVIYRCMDFLQLHPVPDPIPPAINVHFSNEPEFGNCHPLLAIFRHIIYYASHSLTHLIFYYITSLLASPHKRMIFKTVMKKYIHTGKSVVSGLTA
jgi:hypothetical protein